MRSSRWWKQRRKARQVESVWKVPRQGQGPCVALFSARLTLYVLCAALQRTSPTPTFEEKRSDEAAALRHAAALWCLHCRQPYSRAALGPRGGARSRKPLAPPQGSLRLQASAASSAAGAICWGRPQQEGRQTGDGGRHGVGGETPDVCGSPRALLGSKTKTCVARVCIFCPHSTTPAHTAAGALTTGSLL